jgi:DnaK suppressor protein
VAAKSKSSAKKAPAKTARPAAKKGAVETLTAALAKLVKPAAKPAKKAAARTAGKPAPSKAAPSKAVAKKAAPAKKATASKSAASRAAPSKTATKAPAKSQTPARPAATKSAKPVKAPAGKSGVASAVTPARAAKPGKDSKAGKDSRTPAKTARAAGNAGMQMATQSKASAQARPIDSGIRARAVKPSKPLAGADVLPPVPAARIERVDLPEGYKPRSGDGEYMSPLHLEYFRQKLLNWRAELVEESKQTIDNLREEVRDVGDEAERATRETENSLELRTRDRYRKLIGKIDKALKRIDDGAYGFCEETGEEIGIERLEARPIATLCLDAQERWEHRQKLMGD